MESVTYFAPAKVILSGEHAVVYGKPALIAAIGKHIQITVRASSNKENSIPHFITPVVDTVRDYLLKQEPSQMFRAIQIDVTNDIPIGRGLGSSAAFAVAATAALLHFYTGSEPTKEIVNSLAYKAEKHFHGTPSGADNTTCCYGGLIFYRKEFEFLKTISALHAKIPKEIESQLLLIDTGKPVESTAEVVKQVRTRYNKHPEEVDSLLYAIEKTTKRMVVSLVKEDSSGLRETIEKNHQLLVDLGVVSPKVILLLSELSRYGVGKITGAGGISEASGYLLFYADDKDGLIEYLEENGITWIQFTSDLHGVYYKKSV